MMKLYTIFVLLLGVVFTSSVYSSQEESSVKPAPRDKPDNDSYPICNEDDNYYLPIKKRAPKYPIKMLKNEQEAWVLVHYKIKNDGTVGDITVVDSSPKVGFNESAIMAVKLFKYAPIEDYGQQSGICNMFTYSF